MKKQKASAFTFKELLVVVVIITIVAAIAAPNFRQSSQRSPVSRVRSDMRSLATALESYYVDNSRYPAMGLLADHGKSGWPGDLRRNPPVSSFRLPGGGAKLNTLTTPIAYITSYFGDAFAPERGLPFGYYADAKGWILFSPGYDGDYDIVAERDYDSFIPQPSAHLLATVTYDPTNGQKSGGDIWRVKE